MSKWNEQSAPNNNLGSAQIRSSNLVSRKNDHEFSEELSDGGERNEIIKKQTSRH